MNWDKNCSSKVPYENLICINLGSYGTRITKMKILISASLCTVMMVINPIGKYQLIYFYSKQFLGFLKIF